MSRIYEALQRAEQERAAQSIPAPALTQTAVAEAEPALFPEPLIDPPKAAPAPAIDLDTIPAHPWTPDLHHLPALRERGRTVEQFRSLRSRMQELRNASPLKSILITSGLPQEGKSFVAVNLAISFARDKTSRVLLIDGDMRQASLHKVLGCPSEGPGLSEYLQGQATLPEILHRFDPASATALPRAFSSLVFLGAGAHSEQASDLSANPRFQELVAALAPLFDWIVVDSSPVNLVADAANLARACDGILLIARGNVTRYETAQRAVAALKASKILGFVLNAADDSLIESGYYGYNGYTTPDTPIPEENLHETAAAVDKLPHSGTMATAENSDTT